MLRLKDVPESQQSKMAGNSMNTACVGAFLLAAILIFEAQVIFYLGSLNMCFLQVC